MNQDRAAQPPMAMAAAAIPPIPAPSLTASAQPPAARAGRPVSIAIPAIGVSSSVTDVGLTATGTLEVPQPGPHYDEAAWYRNSPTPGTVGPAVIVGHVDSAKSGPSVFFRLGALHIHDLVQITGEDGAVRSFAVDAVQRFAKSAFPTDLVYGNTAVPALRLITCGGPFDRATGHYTDNVVVFAHLVSRNTTAPPVVVQTSTAST